MNGEAHSDEHLILALCRAVRATGRRDPGSATEEDRARRALAQRMAELRGRAHE